MKKSLEQVMSQAKAYSILHKGLPVAVLDKKGGRPVISLSAHECVRLAFAGYYPVGQYLDGEYRKA